jgi:hypothetical protein
MTAHPTTAVLPEPIVYDGDGLLLMLGACIRLALHDFAEGYDDEHHMPARAFLESCGLIAADGSLDLHGHLVATRTYFGRDER